MNDKLAPLFARRSVRQFSADPVPDGVIRDLLEAAMSAPSACGKDPWRFVVVRNRDTLAQMAAGLPHGGLLKTAAAGIVVCGDPEAAHDQSESYLLQDCCAAIENLLLAASMLGWGACWLGVHPRADRMTHLRATLGIPARILPVAAIALGRPATPPPPRVRFDATKAHAERWQA